MTAPDLHLYDVAYLAGGPDRVVDTALVALVESGRVRVHAPGELAVVEPGRSNPVEAAVMDAVGTQGHRTADTIRWRLADDERLLELGRSLAAAGLLRRRRMPRTKPAGRAWSVTRSGRQALLSARQSPPADRVLDGGSAIAVALDGRRAMPDRRLCSEIFERPLPPLPRTSGMGRRIRNSGLHDPDHAAFRGQHTAIGGAATIGFLGGGDGGGGGGGDGGS
jgi:hypothetical protein